MGIASQRQQRPGLRRRWPFPRRLTTLLTSISGTNKGYHIKADNEDAIRAAFERVASMMGGTNEAL